MLLAADAFLLLFISLVRVDAERPSEGGKILELDASGHMLANQVNATGGKETVLLQMEAVVGDNAGRETELRAVLHHAGASEASPRMLIDQAQARNIVCPKNEMRTKTPGCESMCYRLYLTEVRWGYCPEMVADLSRCCHWEPPKKRYWERDAKEKKKVGKSSFGVPYDTLVINTLDEQVQDYMSGLRVFFDNMGSSDAGKFSEVTEKIKLGIDVREAVDTGARALAGRSPDEKALQTLTANIETATASHYKYDAMQEGIAEMKIMANKLRYKLELSKCISEGKKVKKAKDKSMDELFIKLRDTYSSARKVLNTQDPVQHKLLSDSRGLEVSIKKTLDELFHAGTEKAIGKLESEKEAEAGFQHLAMLNERMDKLSPTFNTLLHDTERKADEAKENIRDRYLTAVDEAEQELTIDGKAERCKELCKNLEPKIKFMQDTGFWSELLQRAQTISTQLHAWGLLSAAIEDAQPVIDILAAEAEEQAKKEAERKKMEVAQKIKEEEEQKEQERKQKRIDPVDGKPYNYEELIEKYTEEYPDEADIEAYWDTLKPLPVEEGKGPRRGAGSMAKKVQQAEEEPGDGEEKSKIPFKKVQRLGRALGKALGASTSLPEAFEDEIDKVKDWCGNILQKYGGCPSTPPEHQRHQAPALPHGESPHLQNAAWYSALPSFAVHMIALLVANLWPSF